MISTFSGRYIDPFNPDPDQITPEDLAHSLARIPRFNGHTHGGFYSVAQHSLTVAAIARDRWGLFHDAAEAYIGDMIRPLLPRLGWYRPGQSPTMPSWETVENDLLHAIAERFDLKANEGPDPFPPAVRAADNAVLAAEIRDLFPAGFEGIKPDCEPLKGYVVPWDDIAGTEHAFLTAINAPLMYQ